MTTDEQVHSVAEWCGYKRIDDHWFRMPNGQEIPSGLIPQYDRDLNAIQEAVLKLDESKLILFVQELAEMFFACRVVCDDEDISELVNATASKRLEALCRVLWPERWTP